MRCSSRAVDPVSASFILAAVHGGISIAIEGSALRAHRLPVFVEFYASVTAVNHKIIMLCPHVGTAEKRDGLSSGGHSHAQENERGDQAYEISDAGAESRCAERNESQEIQGAENAFFIKDFFINLILSY